MWEFYRLQGLMLLLCLLDNHDILLLRPLTEYMYLNAPQDAIPPHLKKPEVSPVEFQTNPYSTPPRAKIPLLLPDTL